MSFVEKLNEASLKAFNEAAKKPFSGQAVFFLNAFWHEFGDQAEWIYAVAWDVIKKADMHCKGINYIHLYQEGDDLDFNIGLYFFEKLVKFVDDDASGKWKKDYPKSMPKMMTSIVRKKELRDKVDVNFDGRISFLEYLLYQYEASPKDLMDRSMGQPSEDEDIRKAREALEAVNKSIAAYEAEKTRLTDEAKGGSGTKALKATNELAQLNSGPLWQKLNKDLITAEAAVRIATRRARERGELKESPGGPIRTEGAVWWMNRDLKEKQEKYGPMSKK